jgi:hypothetical protein
MFILDTLQVCIHILIFFLANRVKTGGEGKKSPMIEVKTSPLGKCKQYVGGVVKYPFCEQTELVVQCSTVKHCYHSVQQNCCVISYLTIDQVK